MSILSFVSSSLELSPVSGNSVYENYELKVFKISKFLDKLSNNWPNYLFGTNV